MKINASKLREIYPYSIPLVENDERFYEVTFAKQYIMSTYCRVYKKYDEKHFEKVPMKIDWRNACEYYEITFDGTSEPRKISVGKLVVKVFFPEIKNGFAYRYYRNPFSMKEWKVENLHILNSKEQLVEAIKSKIERRNPYYDVNLQNHIFTNRWIPSKNMKVCDALNRIYKNMKTRATNTNFKNLSPQYEDTTINSDWINNPILFKQYYLDHQYFYPGKTEIDKDILGLGQSNTYAPDLVIEIPRYINQIFTRGSSKYGYSIRKKQLKNGKTIYTIPETVYCLKDKYEGGNIHCYNYKDALIAGRKRKADYIREVVSKEEKEGFIPEYILLAMSKWANLCELGLVKIWEPDEKILAEEGII